MSLFMSCKALVVMVLAGGLLTGCSSPFTTPTASASDREPTADFSLTDDTGVPFRSGRHAPNAAIGQARVLTAILTNPAPM